MSGWVTSVIPVAALAAGYASGLRRSREGRGPVPAPWRIRAFTIGVVALSVALLPPLEGATEESLVWHMVQHVLLVAVAAPLLALADTVPALLWALPERERSGLTPAWRRLVQMRERWWGATAASAGVVHLGVLVGWHLPPLYEGATDNAAVHLVEHATMLMSAAAFWWSVARTRASRHGAGVLVVFATAFVPTVLAAGMTFAGEAWYATYPSLSDQQVAGVVMWLGGGFAYLIGGLALFASWVRAGDRFVDVSAPVGNGELRGRGVSR